MNPYQYFPGNVPIIVSIPHAGTYVPERIFSRLTPLAQTLPDTDWHLEKLYAFLSELGVHVLIATHSRYVIDLNRASNGEILYPGKFTTELCPLKLFDGSEVYLPGMEPDQTEITRRIKEYWQPYHHQLNTLMNNLKQKHSQIAVFDAHSICSKVPLLFEGMLPDLNFGSYDGHSANNQLMQLLMQNCESHNYSSILNGRFKGGYITRHYGKPSDGIHALQLELAQKNYMQESYPFTYEENNAQKLIQVLRTLFTHMLTWLNHANELSFSR